MQKVAKHFFSFGRGPGNFLNLLLGSSLVKL
jgi:hypothetical protein